MKHQCIHSGDHPYSCEVCNKGFSNQSIVIRHKRLHSDELPYVCHVCNKAFSDKNSLKKRLQIHSGGFHIGVKCVIRYSVTRAI